ncbi:MAG: NADH-quinone oxidoreductase subunit L [Acidobacteria bacterium]|nr:NADH-quinone oxidoreductase subunit L [Acidobacteriota bacterium]
MFLKLIWLVPTLPLLSATILGIFGRRFKMSERSIAWLACGSVFVALVITLGAVYQYGTSDRWESGQAYLSSEAGGFPHSFTWVPGGAAELTLGPDAGNPAELKIDWSYQVDPLSGIMMIVVTLVGFLIHVFAVGYMHGDGGYYRFFGELNLFMFMMLTLVMGSNFLMMFVGWEGVGLCSYLLIGHWFDRDEAKYASMKAFIVNRIGDFGFLLAMIAIFSLFGTLQFSEVTRLAADNRYLPMETFGMFGLASWIALGLFVGATGKSAQIPLYVWLPDAMAGPTPVSALIHAATMVTAGVYMVTRTNVIFQKSPTMMFVVAVIGTATLVLAAAIAFSQNDIKKVLAYSTISQLGYMFLACGVGAFSAGIFHVFTHAFFKALLFLGAGSVIIALHHKQDMQEMGGLKQSLPTTYKTFVVAWLAICGIFPLAGFVSKDEILWQAYSSKVFPEGFGFWFWLVGIVGAAMTAFYMTRLMALTFWGKPRLATATAVHHGLSDEHHSSHGPPKESPPVMTIPLILLAVGSALAGFLGWPSALGGSNWFEHWLDPIIYRAPAAHLSAGEVAAQAHDPIEYVLMALSVLLAALVMFVAYQLYIHRKETLNALVEKIRPLYVASSRKFWVDEFYEGVFVRGLTLGSSKLLWNTDVAVVDGGVNGSAWLTRLSSKLSGWVDLYIVDLIVNAVGFVTRIFSIIFRAAQTGLAQNYALVIATGLLIATAAYFFWGS